VITRPWKKRQSVPMLAEMPRSSVSLAYIS
jgi:hypothetical protein